MLVIPKNSKLYTTLHQAAQSKRMVFLVGLPGTGKSLLIQQLALIADAMERTVHLMQYDVSRVAFETGETLAKYPEVDGVTHPAFRKAVGLWSRGAVQAWHEQHTDPKHILIGELPLVGNRLIELVQPLQDANEALLRSDLALFLTAVPSREVRTVIEEARFRTIAEPQHEKEKYDAPPNVLRAMWQDLASLANKLGLDNANQPETYDPTIYGSVFEALLRNRNSQTLLIENLLKPSSSVYELNVIASELRANASDAERILCEIESMYTSDQLAEAVDHWHVYVTQQT